MAIETDGLAASIDAELQSAGTPERAQREQAYLKHTSQHYGTTVPATRRIVKTTLRRHPDLTHDELVALAAELWADPVHERRMATVELLVQQGRLLGPGDIDLLERLLRDSHTWALVDTLAASVVGTLVERFPGLTAVLDRWATDDDFWLRRSAMLALLVPLRRGGGDFDRFATYADALLADREFFIRKCIGWVLRDTGRKRPDLVYEWVLPRASRMSGVTIREALKPLSAAQRAAVLAARSM